MWSGEGIEVVDLYFDTTYIYVSINEDNAEGLVLVNTITNQSTTLSKNYAIKTICFCEEIMNIGINLMNIDTTEQVEYFSRKLFSRINLNTFAINIWGGNMDQE